MRRLATVLLVASVLAVAAPRSVTADCETYQNSRARISGGYMYCEGTGGVCTECTNYTDGGLWSSCLMDSRGFMVCRTPGGGIFLI